MAGSGTGPLPRDIARLTPNQRKAYDWACARVAAGRYAGRNDLARFMEISRTYSSNLIKSINKRVGWPSELKRSFYIPPPSGVLTRSERRALEWAKAERDAGRVVTLDRLAGYLSCSQTQAGRVRAGVERKASWPGVIPHRASGVHGLTPARRRILTMAWDLWERTPRETPTLEALKAAFLWKGSSNYFAETRRICLAKGIWPCRLKRSYFRFTDEHKRFIEDCRRSGMCRMDIPENFLKSFGRMISISSVERILRLAGLCRRNRTRGRLSLEERKADVLAARDGSILSKVDEPLAYRRAMRASRRPAAPSGG